LNIRTIRKLHYLTHIDSLGAVLWLSCHVSVLLCPAFAHARMEIRVQGKSTIEGELLRSTEKSEYRVMGTLSDELRSPITGRPLVFAVMARDPRGARQLDARTCPTDATRALRTESSPVVTDKDGRYCAVLSVGQGAEGFAIQVEYQGDADYVGASTLLDPADSREGLHPRLEAPPYRVSLDDEATTFSLRIAPFGEDASSRGRSLSLLLSIRDSVADPAERSLGKLSAADSNIVPVTVSSNDWREAGPAILLVRFAGDAHTRPFELQHPVLRTLRVATTAKDLPLKVTAGEKLSFTCEATTRRGPLSTGSIEIAVDGVPMQVVATSRTGSAAVEVTAPKTPGAMKVSLRYVPTSEGYVAGAAEDHILDVVEPSPWRHTGWAAAGVFVLVWFALSRRRIPQVTREPRTATPPPPRAHVELLGPPSQRNVGWDGLVVDAHEGTPLPGAQICVYQPGFGSVNLLYETESDAEGTFSIPTGLVGAGAMCELAVRSQRYSSFRTALTAPGHLRVHLVSVRRALLDRLVEWTKRRGAPFRAKPEPTPDWVAEIARIRGHTDVERWANAVSAAAFGPAAPQEAQTPDLEPPAGPGSHLPADELPES
jgi:hypothetical protein